jgi:hypothetical protein
LTEPEVHGLLRVAGESKRGHAKRNYGLLQLLLQTGLQVRVAKRDRSNKRGEPELGVDTGWKVFLANQHAQDLLQKPKEEQTSSTSAD